MSSLCVITRFQPRFGALGRPADTRHPFSMNPSAAGRDRGGGVQRKQRVGGAERNSEISTNRPPEGALAGEFQRLDGR